jgi:hypothetical protein
MTRRDDHPTGHEPYELRIAPVARFALALSAGTVLVLGLMRLVARVLGQEAREGAHAIHPLAAERELPPEPRLQETPALDLARFRAREEERLSTYGWVDRPSGVVHIPIERAMDIVAREGLPARRQ